MFCRLLASTPQIAEVAVFLRGDTLREILRRIGGALTGWVVSVTDRRGFLKQKHGRRKQKMTTEQLMGMTALFAVVIYLYYLTITPKL